jgi:RNA polymerase sigma-70 factor (ECF subfamily)
MTRPDPLELARRAAAGDRAALEELLLAEYERLLARIESKLPRDLVGALGAEDALQDTYAEIARRIGEFEPRNERSFFNWACTLADHRVIDLVRAARAAKRGGDARQVHTAADADASVIDLLGHLASHERTPSRSAAGREAVAAIRAGLAQVGDDYREALRRRYIEGLPVAQIAAEMGRTEASVHMLCHRGLRQLAEILGESSDYLSRKQ